MSSTDDTQFFHFSNRVAGRIMCFVGGYIDCVGYVLLYLLFVASVTGNIIKFAKFAGDGIFTTSFFIVTFAFGVGGGVGKTLSMYLKKFPSIHDQHITVIFFLVESLLLFIPMILGSQVQDTIMTASNGADNIFVIIVGIMMAVAMGFQNISSGMVLKGFPNTTGMTATMGLVCYLYKLHELKITNFFLFTNTNIMLMYDRHARLLRM